MNEAFGNPEGDFKNIDRARVLSQCKNIFDEYLELLKAFGLDHDDPALDIVVKYHAMLHNTLRNSRTELNVDEARDALCDIQVFAQGGQHFMGVDGDADMAAVVNGVMTRFIKNDADKEATIALHAAKGVTEVYFEGEYPKMVMKSAVDQPDAPKGKFLKSASYCNTVFPDPEAFKTMTIFSGEVIGFEEILGIAQLCSLGMVNVGPKAQVSYGLPAFGDEDDIRFYKPKPVAL